MADTKISNLSAITTLSGTDELVVASSGASKKITGTNLTASVSAGSQPLDSDLTAIAALSPSNDDLVQRKAGAWTNRTIAQLLSDLAAAGTTFQPLDSDLTAIAGLSPSNDDLVQRKAGAWTNRTLAQLVADIIGTSGSTVCVGNDSRLTDRIRDFRTALGLITENFDLGACGTNGTFTSQRIDAGAVYLYAGESVNNIVLCVTNAASGAAPTELKVGLWSSAATPVCLAVSNSLKSDAIWTSTGIKAAPLSGAYTVPASGVYYAALLINGAFGGTALQCARSGNGFAGGSGIGSNPQRNPRIKTGATDMAVNDTGTYGGVGTSAQWWYGIS